MDTTHHLVGQVLTITGETWTIIGKEEWGSYVVLSNAKGDTIIRPIGAISRYIELTT